MGDVEKMSGEDKFNLRTKEGFDFKHHKNLSTSGEAIVFNCIYCCKELCQDPENIDRWASEGIVCPFCNLRMTMAELLRRLTEYDRLKKIVEDAPHSRDCPSEATTYKTVDGPPICSLPCWKKEITP